MTATLRSAWLALAFCLGLGGLALADQPAAVPAQSVAVEHVLVLLRTPPDHVRPSADYSGNYGDAGGRSARRRVASRLAHAHGLVLLDDWPMPLLGVDCFIMDVRDGRSAEEVAAALAREPGVAGAEASHVFKAQGRAAPAALRGDPLFRAQPAAREWRLEDLRELATGRAVRVAVIDSMVDADHPDLAGQVVVSQNFVAGGSATPEDHGTAVAGIIAARADNGIGIAGVAPGARIMALRACWQLPADRTGPGATVCDTLSLAKALHYAVDHNAQVINLSLSGPQDLILQRLIEVAVGRGIKVVAAYDSHASRGGFPASQPGVIAVSDEAVARLPAGVYTAPGRDVPTTEPGGRWNLVNGSSFAAAHVSGLLALVRERRPLEPNAPELVTARSGGGEIDACASLLRVSYRNDCACAHPRGYAGPIR